MSDSIFYTELPRPHILRIKLLHKSYFLKYYGKQNHIKVRCYAALSNSFTIKKKTYKSIISNQNEFVKNTTAV